MQLQQTPEGVSVLTALNRPVLRYAMDPRFRPHIHPLFVPGTDRPMTRFRPADHPWQYGLFTGMNKVNGFDFWCCGDALYPPEVRGSMRPRELRDVGSDASGAGFTGVCDWFGPDGRRLIEERQSIRVPHQDAEEALAFDFDWTLEAIDEPVSFAESAYGGLSARLTGEPGTRRHLNSEGLRGDDCAEARARWVSVAQPVDGVGVFSDETKATYAYAGLAIFDHPGNRAYPNAWRVDPHGMIGPSVPLSEPIEIPAGGGVSLKYRVFAFRGLEDGERIESAYREWIGRDGS